MDKNGKHENMWNKIMLSCDSFGTAYSAMLVFFFLPYVRSYDNFICAAFMPLCALIPLAVMPLLYSFVHRSDTLLFGRYHIIMPLSAFMAALFFAVMFAADGNTPLDACMIFFGGALFSCTFLLYEYCSFSVRARLLGENSVFPNVFGIIFSAAGAFTAVISIYAYKFYGGNFILNSAYTVAAVSTALAIVQYLTSFYGIPRLGGRRVVPVKSAYRAFYTGLDFRTFFSSLLFLAAFAVTVSSAVFMSFFAGLAFGEIIGCAGAAFAAYVLTALYAHFRIKRRMKRLSVEQTVIAAGCAALMITAVCASLPHGTIVALTVICGLLGGAGGAIAVRQARLRFLTLKPRVTSGHVFILIKLAFCAVFSIAATVGVCVLAADSMYAFIGAAGAAVVFSAAALVIAQKKPHKTDIPELSYELDENVKS